jgi:hypothetical protein
MLAVGPAEIWCVDLPIRSLDPIALSLHDAAWHAIRNFFEEHTLIFVIFVMWCINHDECDLSVNKIGMSSCFVLGSHLNWIPSAKTAITVYLSMLDTKYSGLNNRTCLGFIWYLRRLRKETSRAIASQLELTICGFSTIQIIRYRGCELESAVWSQTHRSDNNVSLDRNQM